MNRIEKAVRDPLLALRYLLGPVERCSVAARLAVFSRYPVGTNVFTRDWDLLLVLDCCRVDAIRAVADEYDFITDVGSITSVGSATSEWVSQTFHSKHRDEVATTAYLSGNGHSRKVLEEGFEPEYNRDAGFAPTAWGTVEASELGYLEHVWEYANYFESGEGKAYVDPELMTDRTIEFYREHGDEYDRVISHYIPPHPPYIGHAHRDGRDDLYDYEWSPWDYMRNGGCFETVWEVYLSEVRSALDAIEVLLSNVDAEKVVITADHGEAMGEHGLYSHPEGALHPKVKRVPWVETTATDERTRSPNVIAEVEESTERANLEEHLQALGYAD
jgi:hypothetical protein